MVVFPNAKINIGLNIVEKRKDNFHNIETVFYSIGLTDILEAVETRLTDVVRASSALPTRFTLQKAGGKTGTGMQEVIFVSTGLKIPGDPVENLCLKAHKLLRRDYDIPPLRIHLHKIIPMGAGLGGGSTDAAHIIHLLDKKFSLRIPLKKKLDYARQIGSDCSFFIKNKPAFACGRGEKLQDIYPGLAGYYMVLICPPIHVSTKDAYSDVIPLKKEQSLKELIKLPIEEWRKSIFNQFEDTVFKKFPGIGKIKKQLYDLGAVYASMSGSGSSVYGIFDSPLRENTIKMKFRDCFVWHECLGK